MQLSNSLKKMGVGLAMAGLLGGQLTPVYASMVSTETVLQQAQRSVDRSALLGMLEREDVQTQLEAMGVDTAAAKQRVASMTDEEIRQLSARLGEMPAGGDGLGILLFLFLVFVVTDMLGATDIFPFVHPITK